MRTQISLSFFFDVSVVTEIPVKRLRSSQPHGIQTPLLVVLNSIQFHISLIFENKNCTESYSFRVGSISAYIHCVKTTTFCPCVKRNEHPSAPASTSHIHSTTFTSAQHTPLDALPLRAHAKINMRQHSSSISIFFGILNIRCLWLCDLAQHHNVQQMFQVFFSVARIHSRNFSQFQIGICILFKVIFC